jgi:hypothetical protein
LGLENCAPEGNRFWRMGWSWKRPATHIAAADAIASLRTALASQIEITNTERALAESLARKLQEQPSSVSDEDVERACRAIFNGPEPDRLQWDELVAEQPAFAEEYRAGIRRALESFAQREAKPVAMIVGHDYDAAHFIEALEGVEVDDIPEGTILYTAPPQSAPKSSPASTEQPSSYAELRGSIAMNENRDSTRSERLRLAERIEYRYWQFAFAKIVAAQLRADDAEIAALTQRAERAERERDAKYPMGGVTTYAMACAAHEAYQDTLEKSGFRMPIISLVPMYEAINAAAKVVPDRGDRTVQLPPETGTHAIGSVRDISVGPEGVVR